jgi:phage terminase large subunit
VDFGYSIDPSVLVQCSIVGKTLYVTHEAYMVGCEIDSLPDLFMTVPAPRSGRPRRTAPGPRRSAICKHGFPKIFSAIKGAKSLEEGIEFLRSFDIVVHPRCKHTIDELTLYSYETDPLTEGAAEAGGQEQPRYRLLRYACEAREKVGREQTETKVKQPVSWMG